MRARRVKYSNGGYGIKLTFPFSRLTLEKVRTLPGRKWHPKEKFWTVPLSPPVIEQVSAWGFELSDTLKSYRMESDVVDLIPNSDKLYPFQVDGVKFIESKKGRVLIADQMGLGKTAQSLTWLEMHKEARPAIVVCPASLKLNWQLEVSKWTTGETVDVLYGRKCDRRLDASIIIINYDILGAWSKNLRKLDPKALVIDEIHKIKNGKTKQTKAVRNLSRGIKHVIGLSGTPIVNRPIEAYNAIRIINPLLFPKYFDFAERYCGAKMGPWGWDMKGATNTKELHKVLTSSMMIRRLKSDVLKELPDKSKTYVPIELTNRKAYDRGHNGFIRNAKNRSLGTGADALVQIEELKQLSIEGKMKGALKWITTFLESGEKLVVFGIHRKTVDDLMNAFPGISVKVDGSVVNEKRQEAVERFQNDPECKLFVGNIQAAGVGLTLTASSSVVFLELPWTPAELEQAEDRVHRITQKDAVNVYYLLGENTIDQTIVKMLDKKKKVLDGVLDGKDTEKGSLLKDIIEEYENVA
jgi:SWI/SNF-related matrix-associated actin-dependent regulator of chromatin subfamily A-like protein 1